jgi:hypothetical protein
MSDDPHRSFSVWFGMWTDEIVREGDFAHFLQGLIAETGDVDFFTEAPVEVQKELISQLERFRLHGDQWTGVPGGTGPVDTSKEAERCLKVLVQAGFMRPARG